MVNRAKITKVMTSCMTLSWSREKGPPLAWKPMRLAGTWRVYSKNAIPQDNKIMAMRGQWVVTFISCSLRWPYQAKVMKILEKISRIMV